MSVVDYLEGMDYRFGTTTLKGEKRGQAVKSDDPTSIQHAGGQTVTLDLQKAETQEDIKSALKVDTSVSASYGFFSASASFNFAE